MCLVDDDKPGGGGQRGQDLVAEAWVVEPLRADQQDVDVAAPDVGVDRLPLLDVAGVDRHGTGAGAPGGSDLVAHQRQQRADDDRRARAAGAQERGGDEVDGRLAPAGALDNEGPPAVLDEGADGGPLVPTKARVVPGERPQVCLGLVLQGHGRCTPDIIAVRRSSTARTSSSSRSSRGRLAWARVRR